MKVMLPKEVINFDKNDSVKMITSHWYNFKWMYSSQASAFLKNQ